MVVCYFELWFIEIGVLLEAYKEKATRESEIGFFLEACIHIARWLSELGEFLQACRVRVRRETR